MKRTRHTALAAIGLLGAVTAAAGTAPAARADTTPPVASGATLYAWEHAATGTEARLSTYTAKHGQMVLAYVVDVPLPSGTQVSLNGTVVAGMGASAVCGGGCRPRIYNAEMAGVYVPPTIVTGQHTVTIKVRSSGGATLTFSLPLTVLPS